MPEKPAPNLRQEWIMHNLSTSPGVTFQEYLDQKSAREQMLLDEVKSILNVRDGKNGRIA